MTLDDPTKPTSITDIDIEHEAMAEQIASQSGEFKELKTPLDACLSCPHFRRLCRSTVSGLFGLIGRRPPAA